MKCHCKKKILNSFHLSKSYRNINEQYEVSVWVELYSYCVLKEGILTNSSQGIFICSSIYKYYIYLSISKLKITFLCTHYSVFVHNAKSISTFVFTNQKHRCYVLPYIFPTSIDSNRFKHGRNNTRMLKKSIPRIRI